MKKPLGYPWIPQYAWKHVRFAAIIGSTYFSGEGVSESAQQSLENGSFKMCCWGDAIASSKLTQGAEKLRRSAKCPYFDEALAPRCVLHRCGPRIGEVFSEGKWLALTVSGGHQDFHPNLHYLLDSAKLGHSFPSKVESLNKYNEPSNVRLTGLYDEAKQKQAYPIRPKYCG